MDIGRLMVVYPLTRADIFLFKMYFHDFGLGIRSIAYHQLNSAYA